MRDWSQTPNAVTPTTAQPVGQFEDDSEPNDGTGTVIGKQWVGDIWGLVGLAQNVADITPNGSVDNATTSNQLCTALALLLGHVRTSRDPSWGVVADGATDDRAAMASLLASAPDVLLLPRAGNTSDTIRVETTGSVTALTLSGRVSGRGVTLHQVATGMSDDAFEDIGAPTTYAPIVLDGATVEGITFTCSSDYAPRDEMPMLSGSGTFKGCDFPDGAMFFPTGDVRFEDCTFGADLNIVGDAASGVVTVEGGAARYSVEAPSNAGVDLVVRDVEFKSASSTWAIANRSGSTRVHGCSFNGGGSSWPADILVTDCTFGAAPGIAPWKLSGCVRTDGEPMLQGSDLCRGVVSDSGSKVNGLGFSSSRLSTGKYQITFDTPAPDANYSPLATIREATAATFGIQTNNLSTTGFQVWIRHAGTLANYDFSVSASR